MLAFSHLLGFCNLSDARPSRFVNDKKKKKLKKNRKINFIQIQNWCFCLCNTSVLYFFSMQYYCFLSWKSQVTNRKAKIFQLFFPIFEVNSYATVFFFYIKNKKLFTCFSRFAIFRYTTKDLKKKKCLIEFFGVFAQ